MPPRDLFEEAGIVPGKASTRDLFAEAGIKAEDASNVLAVPDFLGAVGSRMVAGPAAGLAGIAGTLLPGKPGQGADWTKAVHNATSYDPRTPGGGAMFRTASIPGEYLSEFARSRGEAGMERARDAGLGETPLASTATETLINSIPMLLAPAAGSGVGAIRNSSIAERSRNLVRDTSINQAKDAGYVFPPSAVGSSGFFNNLLESIGGKAALKQESVKSNQPVTNRLAVADAGLPENTAMTPEILANRRNVIAQPYREARAIDPAVNQMVDDLQTARADFRDYRRAYNGPTGRPADRVAMQQAEARVTALEQQIEAAAVNSGNPGLAQRIRDARPQIAKLHDIEEALNRGTGDVSAPRIGAEYAGGAPLTGNLATIGRTQNALRQFMGEDVATPAPGVNNLGPMASAALGMQGAAHGAGTGILAGGLPFLGGPMRSMILSDPYQALFARPPMYLGSRLPQVSDPYLRGILATTTNQGALSQ